jgi:antitoxin PrlF
MRVTSKGQVTIPHHLRRSTGIRAGTEVEFRKRGEKEIVLREAAPRGRSARQPDEFADYLDRVTGVVDLGMTTDQFLELLRGE